MSRSRCTPATRASRSSPPLGSAQAPRSPHGRRACTGRRRPVPTCWPSLSTRPRPFSPTTRYRDYAISRELIHWESQSSHPRRQRYGPALPKHEQARSLDYVVRTPSQPTTAPSGFLGRPPTCATSPSCRWRSPGACTTPSRGPLRDLRGRGRRSRCLRCAIAGGRINMTHVLVTNPRLRLMRRPSGRIVERASPRHEELAQASPASALGDDGRPVYRLVGVLRLSPLQRAADRGHRAHTRRNRAAGVRVVTYVSAQLGHMPPPRRFASMRGGFRGHKRAVDALDRRAPP